MDGFSNPAVPRRARMALLLIICAGILARLYGIDGSLFGHHGQRQIDTAAIARNFSEGSMNFLYPQIDWRGNSPGYVESEFPAYTYSVALLYRVFGPHEWVGRALNIFFYALSAAVLFSLTRRLFDERIATLGVLIYSFVPLNFYFTRTFQPDAMMCLSSLAGLYFFWIWTETKKLSFLFLSALGVALAILIKPTNLYLGLPLLYLCHRRFGWKLFREPVLYLFAIVVTVPSALWYAHAARLWETYGNSLFRIYVEMGIPSPTDKAWLFLGRQLLTRLIFAIATPAGVLLLLMGLTSRPPSRNYLLHWWAAGFGVSVLIAAHGHRGHDYYQLPMVFPCAIWMASGLAALWDKRAAWRDLTRAVVAAVALIAAASVFLAARGSSRYIFFLLPGILIVLVWGTTYWVVRRRQEGVPQGLSSAVVASLCLSMVWCSLLQLGSWMSVPGRAEDRIAFGRRVSELTEPGTPLVFLGSNPLLAPYWYQHRTAQGEILYWDPVDFYTSHRKGWSIDESFLNAEFIDTLHRRGAKYFATVFPEILERNSNVKAALDRTYKRVEETPRWVIYRLDDLPDH